MLLIDNKRVDFGQFPNGESNLNFNKLTIRADSVVTLKFESDLDLFNLFILKQYIDSIKFSTELVLKILYMPYSRMDRPNQFYTFNLKYVCNFINSLNFARVLVYEPHSDVTLALLDRCQHYSPAADLFGTLRAWVTTPSLAVMFPDAGAEKRYGKTFCFPTVVGQKSRDFGDGKITGMKVSGAAVNGQTVVIIDDLCSRGGTFVAAAKALREQGAIHIYLVVTHCENTIFDGEIFDHIEKVYTTNSILDIQKVRAKGLEGRFEITPLYKEITDGY